MILRASRQCTFSAGLGPEELIGCRDGRGQGGRGVLGCEQFVAVGGGIGSWPGNGGGWEFVGGGGGCVYWRLT